MKSLKIHIQLLGVTLGTCALLAAQPLSAQDAPEPANKPADAQTTAPEQAPARRDPTPESPQNRRY